MAKKRCLAKGKEEGSIRTSRLEWTRGGRTAVPSASASTSLRLQRFFLLRHSCKIDQELDLKRDKTWI